jgi:hypothetical protein
VNLFCKIEQDALQRGPLSINAVFVGFCYFLSFRRNLVVAHFTYAKTRFLLTGFSYKKQQRCEIFVELPFSAIPRGAAHRNIKIGYGALHLENTYKKTLYTKEILFE